MPARAPAFWRRRGAFAWLLYPLSLLFGALARMRRQRTRVERLPVPVIVVGNIAVGGSGKTPVVQWLVARLRAAGYSPGIVSRGHGGTVTGVAQVPADGDPAAYGDEPVLLAVVRLSLVGARSARGARSCRAVSGLRRDRVDVACSIAAWRAMEIAVVDPASATTCCRRRAVARAALWRLGEVTLCAHRSA